MNARTLHSMALCSLAAALSSEVGAQSFLGRPFGTVEFEAGLGFEGGWQHTSSAGIPDTDSRYDRFLETIGIRSQGFFILDPRLFTGNLGATFALYQENDRTDGIHNATRGTLTAYNFDAVLLSGKPYTGTVYANRGEYFSHLPFGGNSKIKLENAGATFRLREDSILRDWGFPWCTAQVTAYQQRFSETTTTAGTPFRRDQTNEVISANAHKGFETADLDFNYQYENVDDHVFPQDSFRTQTAALNSSLDFGPGLNRRWESRLRYYDRAGAFPLRAFDVSEDVRIDHYDNLFTDYSYLFNRNEQESGTTTIQTAAFLVQHRLGQSLTTTGLVQGNEEQLPEGKTEYYAGQLNFAYQHGVPLGGELNARLGGRYQVDNNNLTSPLISVVDESHVAPPVFGPGTGFLLGHSFVEVSTIVVVDTQGGGRQVATLGTDYEVIAQGDQTLIVPIANSPVIRPGDSLAVSYSYVVPAQLKFDTKSWWVGGRLDYGWIVMGYDHTQSIQTPISGSLGHRLLQDFHQDLGTVGLRGTWRGLQAQANATYQRYDATSIAYNERLFDELLTYTLPYNVVLGFAAVQSFTNFTLPIRRSDRHSYQGTLDWYFGPWTVTGYARWRSLTDTQLPKEIAKEAGITARLNYGKLSVNASFLATEYERGGTSTRDLRVQFGVLRRF